MVFSRPVYYKFEDDVILVLNKEIYPTLEFVITFIMLD